MLNDDDDDDDDRQRINRFMFSLHSKTNYNMLFNLSFRRLQNGYKKTDLYYKKKDIDTNH